MARKFDLDAELQMEFGFPECPDKFDLDEFLADELETAPPGEATAWGLRPAKGDPELVEVYHRTLGEKLITSSHPYTAEYALSAANNLGGNGGRHPDHPSWTQWMESFTRKMNQIYWAVECAACIPRRGVGQVCLRPSGANYFFDKSHAVRRKEMDEWLMEQVPIWPLDMHQWLRQRGK